MYITTLHTLYNTSGYQGSQGSRELVVCFGETMTSDVAEKGAVMVWNGSAGSAGLGGWFTNLTGLSQSRNLCDRLHCRETGTGAHHAQPPTKMMLTKMPSHYVERGKKDRLAQPTVGRLLGPRPGSTVCRDVLICITYWRGQHFGRRRGNHRVTISTT